MSTLPTTAPKLHKELSDRGRQLLRTVVSGIKLDNQMHAPRHGRSESLRKVLAPTLDAHHSYAANEGKRVNIDVAAFAMTVSVCLRFGLRSQRARGIHWVSPPDRVPA